MSRDSQQYFVHNARGLNYQLRQVSPKEWEIFDHLNDVRFQGSLRACEDWLDHQEALNQKTWYESIRERFVQLFEKESQTSSSQLENAQN
ncbi:MAG: hypothetical protein HUJ26_07065 [Planctomycetaceae bacterium]|nr:hypothetical protein [Planctomycetaceae bacterium]